MNKVPIVVSYYVCNLKNRYLAIHDFTVYIIVFIHNTSIIFEKEMFGIILTIKHNTDLLKFHY